MKKSLLKKYLFSLLVFLLLILGYPLVQAQRKEKGSQHVVRYTSQDLRDPFQSPFELEAKLGRETIEEPQIRPGLPHIQVQGMVWGSEMPQAIINNTVVKVGEVIAGAEVLDIRREGVYVLYEGRQYILRPVIPTKK